MGGLFSIAVATLAKEKDAKEEPEEALDFRTVYDEHFTFAWRSLRALGVPAPSIDDAAQDVFVVVHRKLDTVISRSRLKSWVFGIARRVASDYRRSHRRKGISVEFNEEISRSEGNNPYRNASQRQALAAVEEFLNTLDDERRSIFVLSEMEQMPVSEISGILDVNQNTIYSRLKVMKNDLEAHMEHRLEEKAGEWYD